MMSVWCNLAGVWVLLTSVLLASSAPEPPRCHHALCQNSGRSGSYHYYEVEGNTISIKFKSGLVDLLMDCEGASVLESPALPSVQPAQYVEGVKLQSCPPPANGSLADSLARLNLTFCKHDTPEDPCELLLYNLPPASPLAAKHFIGFEHLRFMTIETNTRSSPECCFLKALRSLVQLKITGVFTLPAELDALPHSLETLELVYTVMERVPEAIHSSVSLRELTITAEGALDAVAVPPSLLKLELQSQSTTLRLDAAPALEMLWLENWAELLPSQVMSCPALRQVYLKAPAMLALPTRWLVFCRNLVELTIEAHKLTTLPPKLFSANSPLARLAFIQGTLETLPEGLLDDVPKLQMLQLKKNHINILPRNSFQGLDHHELSELDLSSNELDGSVFDVLEQLKSPEKFHGDIGAAPRLTKLDLSHNPRIGDVCDADGYSRIIHMTNLLRLHLSDTGVSRICRDWREEMPELRLLDLKNTNISVLSVEDLQFRRRVQAEVLLLGAPVTALRVTREDFNAAVSAPPSLTSVYLDAELTCDCRLYWLRRTLEHPRAQVTLPGLEYKLRCLDNGVLLSDKTSEELVCEARGECAAAALPAGCECAARPDHDSARERWLVRVHCGNNSGFVPRRIYPFYPLYYGTNNQATYLTESINITLN